MLRYTYIACLVYVLVPCDGQMNSLMRHIKH